MRNKLFYTTLFMLIAMFFLYVGNVYAHTVVQTTTPEDGQKVKEQLEKIEVTFAGKILEPSTMELIDENENVIAFSSLSVQETSLIGELSEELQNGDYIVQWKVVAEDGHILEGDLTFTVEKEELPDNQQETPVEERAEEIQTDNEIEAEVEEEAEVPHQEEEVIDEPADTTNSGGLSTMTILLIAIVIIIVIVIIIISIKGKKGNAS